MNLYLPRRFLLAAASAAALLFVAGLLLWGGSERDGHAAALVALPSTTAVPWVPSKAKTVAPTVTTATTMTTTAAAPTPTTPAPPATTRSTTTRPPAITPQTTPPTPPPTTPPPTSPPPPPPTTAPPAPPASVTVAAPGSSSSDASIASWVVAAHNRERAARGLPPLRRSSCLDAVASSWASQLAFLGQLAHNPAASVATGACVLWHAIGENLGYDATVENLEDAWMQSSVHQANILDPDFTQIGVGVVHGRGLVYVVVDFAG